MTTTSPARKTSASGPNFIIPPPENVHRPGFLFLLIIALAFLIGFGYMMYTAGSSKGTFISILLLITTAFSLLLWWTVLIARAEVPKMKKFKESGYWASWTLSPEEYRKYASSVRGETAARLMWPFSPVAIAGVYVAVTVDRQAGVFVILADLAFIALAIMVFSPPRIPRNKVCEVHINAYGMLVAGRFTAFRGGHPRLRRVDFQPGDPGMLVFTLKWTSSHEPTPTRVPVPQGHWDDAVDLAHDLNVRFRAIKS